VSEWVSEWVSELDSYLLESTPSKTHAVASKRPDTLKSIIHMFTYFLYTLKRKKKEASRVNVYWYIMWAYTQVLPKQTKTKNTA